MVGQAVRRTPAAALLVLAAACSREAPLVSRAPGASRSVVLRNVRVFDAPRAVVAEGLRDVVVRDGRIAAVAPPGVVAAGIAGLDGHGGTLLPGLVDVHTHTGASAYPPWQVVFPDVQDNLAAFLYAGVTTVLDLGNLTPGVFRERARIASGAHLGPRLYAAGPIFTAPGGHPAEVLRAWLPWYLRWYVLPRATREVSTAADARQAIAALLPERPDVLKLAIDARTGAVPRLDVEMIAAITAAGHAAGLRTVAHVGSSQEAGDAVRGRNGARLRSAGVPVLVGSDACNPGGLPGGGLHLELSKLVEAGLTPGEALRSATWENARFLGGEGADFGEIAVGKRADLVLVDGDPVARIDDLGKITRVLLDGTVLARRTHA